MCAQETVLSAALLAYCQARLPSRPAGISGLRRISDGWESDVYSFSLVGESDGGGGKQGLILRLYPGQGGAAKCIREFRAMEWLYRVGYPVPRVLVRETDNLHLGRPFLIMERIEGRPLAAVMSGVPPEVRRQWVERFCAMFVDLHRLDWQRFVADPPAYEDGRLVERWLAWVEPYISALPESGFEAAIDWLRAHRAQVRREHPAFVHWDYHPNNILVTGHGAAYVIDWTGAEVTDYRFDLAWTLVLSSGYSGMAVRDEILAGYERRAGERVESIEYFEVAACLRRLFSIVFSVVAGAEKLGMRPGAEAQIKSNARHIGNVHALLRARTGLTVPAVERLLEDLGRAP